MLRLIDFRIEGWTARKDVDPGQFVHVDGQWSDAVLNTVTAGEVYRIVWEDDGGQRLISEHTF